MEFKVLHILREGNCCVDKLANMSLVNRENLKWYFFYILVLVWIFFIIDVNFQFIGELSFGLCMPCIL